MDLGLFNSLWTKIHKILKGSENVPSLDDVWEAAKAAWESITSVDIEVLFQTLHTRMEQVVECDGRNDMEIPHTGIRQRVEEEDTRLKNS